MTIKKVTLKNIKRSYRRIVDNTWGNDMGYWFGERRDDMEYMRGVGSIREVLECGKSLVYSLKECEMDEYIVMAERWVARWSAACDACGV